MQDRNLPDSFLHAHHKMGWGFFSTSSLPTPFFLDDRMMRRKNVMNTSLALSSSSVFNFDAEHNGNPCIISTRQEDQGTVNQVWFTAKMLATFFECSDDTIRRRVEMLVQSGDLDEPHFCVSLNVPNSNGRGSVKSVIYNLAVLNKIAMTFIDNQRAVEIRKAFNDILVKEETAKNTLPALSAEDNFFLNILHASSQEETALALKEYKNYRDERERELERQKDEAVKKRTAINDKRTATLMVKSREDNKKINQLTCENNELKEQNEILQKDKEQLIKSFGCTPEKHDWLTVSVMRDIWQKNFKKEPQWYDLKRIIKENGLVHPIKDVKEIVNNKEKFVNRYPRRAWEIYFDEEMKRKNQTEE